MTVQPLFETLDPPTSLATATSKRDSSTLEGAPVSTQMGDGPPEAESTSEEARSRLLRTQFLRRVAHDIASPAGVTMTVLEELAAESSRPELVAMARRGLRRLLRLSEQLALTADVEAGALSPDTTIEDVRALVKDALEQALTVDGRRNIVTSCEVPGERLVVDVDRRLLCSVLREVIGNALRLASSRVTVDVSKSSEAVTVRVEDDGPGFAPEALTNLGRRFVPGSTTRGLGLSLALAKDVLSAHGGDLSLGASTLPPGRRGSQGAAVTISLPSPSEPR